ncbi:MAG: sulfatase family protein [Opitutales bacterium]
MSLFLNRIIFPVFLLCAYALRAMPAESLNVVLIFADDLGYGDLSSYGQTAYETPHIDRLAQEGALATDYYVPVPYCAPSRGALLTGRVPLRNGLFRNPHPDLSEEHDNVGLSPDELTLAEVYKEHGYATAIFGKWHLGHKPQFYPTRQGFDEYYGILYSNDMLPVQIMENEEVAVERVDQKNLTRDYTEKSVDFINRNAGQPFFLYVPHPMPHKPLAASDVFYTPETPNDLYMDVMREMDWSVGEILEALEENKILENTIVIFTSDNGPFYGGSTGGFRGMKGSSWEGGLRVPFLIRYPKSIEKGMTVAEPLWSLDLFPTLLSLCNIPLPEGVELDGENIVPVFRGNALEPRPIFSFHDSRFTTMRYGDWKLYLSPPRSLTARDLSPNWVDPKGPDGENIIAPFEQPNNDEYPGLLPPEGRINVKPLYNLVADPEESNNLADRFPERVSKMLGMYQEFKDSL